MGVYLDTICLEAPGSIFSGAHNLSSWEPERMAIKATKFFPHPDYVKETVVVDGKHEALRAISNDIALVLFGQDLPLGGVLKNQNINKSLAKL